MKTVNKLSAKTISQLVDGWYCDGAGLWLRVTNGNRRWYYRKQRNHNRITKPLGEYPAISLRDARLLAQGASVEAIPPKDIKNPTVTFEQMALEALEAIARVKLWTNAKHRSQWFNTVRDYAMPVLKDRDVATITPDDILEVLSPIWFTKTTTASRVQERLNKIFEYGLHKGYVKTNPAVWKGNLDLMLPSESKVHQKVHHAAVPIKDIPRMISDMSKDWSIAATAVIFGTLTATRVQEFLYAEWSEIDLDAGIWSIPASRRKDKKNEPFRVPLCPQVVEWLKSIKDDEVERLFPHMDINQPRLILKDKGYMVTMHGMRSTFRDWGAEGGEDRWLMEKCLCHSLGNAVEQAYQRSDCLEQRRPIMERWAAYCFSFTTPPSI